MFQVFRNAWKVAELRKKILYTALIILVFRIGCAIFVPFLNTEEVQGMLTGGENTLLGFMNTMTGGALGNGTLFALSIMPYINASIIMQLLTVAIPVLERLSKEGDEGRKKINKITKFLALGIGIFQAVAFYITLRNSHAVNYTSGFDGFLAMITIVGCFTAGASLIIWLGDQINEKGIGNGISIILFAGIVSRLPLDIYGLVQQMRVTDGGGVQNYVLIPLYLAIYIAMIGLVVLMTNAERRIPVQYAKRVVGRKMYGGQSSHIPIKVAMAGVMPIIFAMAVMSLPQTILFFFGIDGRNPDSPAFWNNFLYYFNQGSWIYAVIYFFMIIGFNYFYISIQYNPIEIANNLKKNNGAIPGYRPGKPTSDFIYNSLSKITLIGAIFLGFIAIFPIVFSNVTNIHGMAMGGTTMLILVGVSLETMRSLEGQMMMRHHKGFLE
ncbi:MAG: preprotein translocase subunit SecY [Oscillospiraceae bacterium]|jgi:preprotein translocase subunit SecY|nr:preprotein translocase subunit SecY [Oscillospiraceae bacterium]